MTYVLGHRNIPYKANYTLYSLTQSEFSRVIFQPLSMISACFQQIITTNIQPPLSSRYDAVLHGVTIQRKISEFAKKKKILQYRYHKS